MGGCWLLSFLSRGQQHRLCLGLGSALCWVPQGRKGKGGSVGAELQVVGKGALEALLLEKGYTEYI